MDLWLKDISVHFDLVTGLVDETYLLRHYDGVKFFAATDGPYEVAVLIVPDVNLSFQGYFWREIIDQLLFKYRNQSICFAIIDVTDNDLLKKQQATIDRIVTNDGPEQQYFKSLSARIAGREYLANINSSVFNIELYRQFNAIAKLLKTNASIVFCSDGISSYIIRNILYNVDTYYRVMGVYFSTEFRDTFYYKNPVYLVSINSREKLLLGSYGLEKRLTNNKIIKRHQNIVHGYNFLSFPVFSEVETEYPIDNFFVYDRFPLNPMPVLTALFLPETFFLISDVIDQALRERPSETAAVSLLSLRYVPTSDERTNIIVNYEVPSLILFDLPLWSDFESLHSPFFDAHPEIEQAIKARTQ